MGPMAAGKSTIGKELAKSKMLQQIPMDRLRWYYYLKDGFDFVKEDDFETSKEKIEYWKPFEAKAVIKIVNDFDNGIIDFGAGHSYFPDEKQFNNVSKALQPIENIFLLLPCEDKEESLKICNERLTKKFERELTASEVEANRDFIFHNSNYKLSKHIIYTKDKSINDTVKEIEKLLV